MFKFLFRQAVYWFKSGLSLLGVSSLITITVWYFSCYFFFWEPCFLCYSSSEQNEFDFRVFAVLVGASAALLTLRRNSLVQRAEFISGYLSQFYTDADLWETYHQLIYRYWDRDFEEIDDLAEEDKKKMRERIENPESYEGPLPPIDVTIVGTDPASRPTYHPWLFQGSQEEKRIDALIGFLNGVDYYCAKGHVSVGEIYRHMGTHLLTLGSKKVMQSYFEINDEAWSQGFQKDMGVHPATKRTRNLLDCVEAYDDLLTIKKPRVFWNRITTGGKSK